MNNFVCFVFLSQTVSCLQLVFCYSSLLQNLLVSVGPMNTVSFSEARKLQTSDTLCLKPLIPAQAGGHMTQGQPGLQS